MSTLKTRLFTVIVPGHRAWSSYPVLRVFSWSCRLAVD
jgi:hypothetical protein